MLLKPDVMKEYGILADPFGLQILIAAELCALPGLGKDQTLYNDYRSVIERPAFVIVMKTDLPLRYYCRSIGWGTTLLIRTECRNGRWKANQCSKNPSDVYLKNLAAKGHILSIH
ncbi:MAG: hypothetical protein JWP88_723 [Flaviaesturariibacter sp.]|nr:hypothetical protein [Flaviaesturariibacter sp.]